MTYTPEQIAAIAEAFTKGLQAAMTPASWLEMLSRHNPETPHCPSHDYCDANEIMGDAITSVVGWTRDDSDAMEAATVEAWNEAWTLARKSWGGAQS